MKWQGIPVINWWLQVIVTTMQHQRAVVGNTYNLCIKELNILVHNVTIKHHWRELWEDIYNQHMKVSNILVLFVTTKQHKGCIWRRIRNEDIRALNVSVINATTWLLDKITRTSTRNQTPEWSISLFTVNNFKHRFWCEHFFRILKMVSLTLVERNVLTEIGWVG